MTAKEDADFSAKLLQVAEAYAACAKKVVPGGPECFGKPKPVKKKQEDTDMLKLRFLPKLRSPEEFWDATWCHYTVAAGQHAKFAADQGRLFTWHIGFLHSPGNSACSSAYTRAITEILIETAAKRPAEFFVVKHNDPRPIRDSRADGWPFLHILRRYYHKEFPTFSPIVIAQDLLWLVQETFPRFRALRS